MKNMKRNKNKKPKVPPVMNSDIKKAKLLKKQLKKMSLNKGDPKKRKVSSSSESESECEQKKGIIKMDVDNIGGKQIQKKNNKIFSRAYYMEWKKAIRRKNK